MAGSGYLYIFIKLGLSQGDLELLKPFLQTGFRFKL